MAVNPIGLDVSMVTLNDGTKATRQRQALADGDDGNAVLAIRRQALPGDAGAVVRLAPDDRVVNEVRDLLQAILDELTRIRTVQGG